MTDDLHRASGIESMYTPLIVAVSDIRSCSLILCKAWLSVRFLLLASNILQYRRLCCQRIAGGEGGGSRP